MKAVFVILLFLVLAGIYYLEMNLGAVISHQHDAHYRARNLSDDELERQIAKLKYKTEITKEEEIELTELEMEKKHRQDLKR